MIKSKKRYKVAPWYESKYGMEKMAYSVYDSKASDRTAQKEFGSLPIYIYFADPDYNKAVAVCKSLNKAIK